MALVVKDRVKETTTTTGTGTITLAGASTGFQSFSVIGNGNTTYYAIVDQTNGAWEVGVGTYTASGTTLSRDTVLESSNAGSLVNFAAGSKDVFVTYPAERSVYLDTAGSAVATLDVGTLGVSTANITTANITSGTVSTTPTSGTDIANKTYVDTIASSGITYHTPVKYEVPNTTGNLNATYNNGSSGVGATLTNAGTLDAFTPDGVVAQVGDRVLVYNQTSAFQNGVYTVTTVGSGSVAWVLTRATDANSYGLKSPTALGEGDAFFVTSGNTGAGETYVCNTSGTITFGTTAITFVQVSDSTLYTAGTGLTLTGTEFSITPVGTAATYGSASQVPVITTNASGQVSSVTNTAIAISSGAVSGLAPSATTDTTNATNITSGTLPTGRLNGSYTGVTGVGTLTAGTWNATAVGAAYGGTGFSSYAVGDILYADTTGSLAKLPDVAYGNVLLSSGVGTAPAYGKVSLTAHITGTLAVSNGGTGATTLTGYVKGNGTGAMTASATVPSSDISGLGTMSSQNANNVAITGGAIDGTAVGATTASTVRGTTITATTQFSGSGAGLTNIPNSATTATSADNASAIVARDSSGNFSAGIITANLSGNATSATTATTATQVSNSLTLATSGIGLSGSATFNGATAQNFTVTSNATSANTASTIVARDASGNFSAGTITATLSGTATNVSGTVAVANGGTGTTSLTANNVIIGNGTSAVQFVAPSTAGNVLTSNGTTWVSSAATGGGLSYVYQTANYTAQNNQGVLTDTSGGAFAVTLPVSPSVGNQVIVADASGAWGTNNLTVARNGSLIGGLAQDLACDISGASVQLVYDGTSWEIYAQIGGNGGSEVTLAGTQTLSNKTIQAGVFTDGYTEEVATANTSTAYTVDLTNGSIQILTLTGNCTFTFPTATAGRSFVMILKQDATGSRTVTWPAAVKWPDNATPTITATASKSDKYVFTADGTNWIGSIAGQNYTL